MGIGIVDGGDRGLITGGGFRRSFEDVTGSDALVSGIG